MKTRLPTLILCASSLFGCSGVSNQISDVVFIPHANSDQRADEAVKLELFYRPTCPAEPAPPAGAKGLPMAGAFADAIITTVGQILAEEAKRYEASYSSHSTEEGFYCSKSQNAVKLAGFRLTRMLDVSEKQPRQAMSFCASIIPAQDKEFFQIVPLQYELNQSKAKVVAFDLTSPFGVDLLNPWEVITDTVMGRLTGIPADDAVDMGFTITLTSIYVADQKLKEAAHAHSWRDAAVEIGSARMNATLKGKLPESFRCEMLTSASAGDYADKAQAAYAGKTAILFPKVMVGNAESLGVFDLRVGVTEFDAYGARINELSAALTKNKKSLTDAITGAVE